MLRRMTSHAVQTDFSHACRVVNNDNQVKPKLVRVTSALSFRRGRAGWRGRSRGRASKSLPNLKHEIISGLLGKYNTSKAAIKTDTICEIHPGRAAGMEPKDSAEKSIFSNVLDGYR